MAAIAQQGFARSPPQADGDRDHLRVDRAGVRVVVADFAEQLDATAADAYIHASSDTSTDAVARDSADHLVRWNYCVEEGPEERIKNRYRHERGRGEFDDAAVISDAANHVGIEFVAGSETNFWVRGNRPKMRIAIGNARLIQHRPADAKTVVHEVAGHREMAGKVVPGAERDVPTGVESIADLSNQGRHSPAAFNRELMFVLSRCGEYYA